MQRYSRVAGREGACQQLVAASSRQLLEKSRDILSTQAKFEQAIQTWDSSYKNLVDLLAQQPNNLLWRRDLAYVVPRLADTLFLIGKPENGLRYFEKPLQVAADDTVLRWARARVALYSGRAETARDDLEAIVNLRPADGNAILWLQVALMHMGQYDRQEFEKEQRRSIRRNGLSRLSLSTSETEISRR